MVKRYAGISFRCSRRVYCFEVGALHLKVNDDVVVETDRGVNIGQVVVSPEDSVLPDGVPPESVKKVLRKARDDDFARLQDNCKRELEAARICQEKIELSKLKMKLVRAEFMHDGNRVIFYFTAENRVDFRELVKDLAHTLHVRVEMRQIGIRDAAGMLGGVGICGRELCCAAFLSTFEPVTVKMAKEQNLALNPMKISGICGRLMCCLGYEYENYRKAAGSGKGGGRNRRGGKGSGQENKNVKEVKDGGEKSKSEGEKKASRNLGKNAKPAEGGAQPAEVAANGREKRKDSGSRKAGSGKSGGGNAGRRSSSQKNSGQNNSGQKNSNQKNSGSGNSGDRNQGKKGERSGKGSGRDKNREKRKN